MNRFTWESGELARVGSEANDLEESRGGADDHFYGAWWQGGGGRGGPMSRGQIVSAPRPAGLSTHDKGLWDLANKLQEQQKYADLNAAHAWLQSKGVNSYATDPVVLPVPAGYLPTRFPGSGADTAFDEDFIDGQNIDEGTSMAYNPANPDQRVTAPFRGTIRKVEGGYEITPAVPDSVQKLGPYYGLDQLTPQLRNRVVTGIEKLDAKYPGIMGSEAFYELVVADRDRLGRPIGNSLATMGLGRMALNSKHFVGLDAEMKLDRGQALADQINWTYGGTLETGIINHEFGHAVDYWLRNSENSPYSHKAAQANMDRLRSELSTTGKWPVSATYVSPQSLFWNFRDQKARGSTEYSYTNHSERFAESFSRLQGVPDGTWEWNKSHRFHTRPKPITPWEKKLRTYLNTIPGWQT